MTDVFIDNLAVLLLALIVMCVVFSIGALVCDWLERRS